MNEYVPTTNQVGYYYEQMRRSAAEYHDYEPPSIMERNAEFDRWLASVKADAWDEGCRAMHYRVPSGFKGLCVPPENPYREGAAA